MNFFYPYTLPKRVDILYLCYTEGYLHLFDAAKDELLRDFSPALCCAAVLGPETTRLLS